MVNVLPSPGGRREATLDLSACERTAAPEAVATALLACSGVEKVHVDAHLTWALVTFDGGRGDADLIIEQMSRTGFAVTLIQLFEADGP